MQFCPVWIEYRYDEEYFTVVKQRHDGTRDPRTHAFGTHTRSVRNGPLASGLFPSHSYRTIGRIVYTSTSTVQVLKQATGVD